MKKTRQIFPPIFKWLSNCPSTVFKCPRAAAPGGKVNLPTQRGSTWLVKVGDLVVWRCESQLTLSPLKRYVYVYVYIIYL